VPDNALTPADLARSSAAEQTLMAWAQAVDSQDPAAVASLFTANGRWSLYMVDRSAVPLQFVPTGYSPSPTPTGGTAGGGCSAAGTQAIANYVRGLGLTGAYAWPVPAQSRTLVQNPLVQLDPTDPTVAIAHAFVISGDWIRANRDQQVSVSFKYDASTGWKISDLRQIYETARPTYPCQN
jgi:hypothetical protein